jgi:hypothetical protein
MVKFVCYFLRIIADEEAWTARINRSKDSDSNSDSVISSSSAGSSGSSRTGSDANSGSSSRPHRGQRKKKETDWMKDARELFC